MLKIDKLTVSYGGAKVLNDLSFEIKEGESVSILGSNGAGKTTLLKSISGLIRPKQGSIWFMGKRVDQLAPDRIVGAGIVHCPEGRRVFPELSVAENLRLGATRRRDGERERLQRVYGLFPALYERRAQRAISLSGGEQQMLALGRALMGDPRLLMLDEPSLGLAPALVDIVFQRIIDIQKGGVTTLLVEQNAELALGITDRAYVLERGEIVTEGASSGLMESEQIRKIYLGVEEVRQ